MKLSVILTGSALVSSISAFPSAKGWGRKGDWKPRNPWKNEKPWKGPWGNKWWPSRYKPAVTAGALVDKIQLNDLLVGSQVLQDFSDAYWQKNRVFGSAAHMDTVNYLYNEVLATGYYDVYKQEQIHLWSDANQTLSIGGVAYTISSVSFGVNGNVTGGLVPVANLGCALSDFPPTVAGQIAFISRGNCTFSNKVALGGAAGAAGVIIYNNVPGALAATLSSESNALGPYVPVATISGVNGTTVSAALALGPVSASLYVSAVAENRTTYNVIAQTKGGNPEAVVALGAHTDSVNAGPGINDDGSGSIGLLAVAKALTGFSVENAVRFCWWTAEEYGLLGSEFYVASLNETEVDKVALYMNFDMIASPNYVYAIYDGDGSAFNISGPTGSAEIETLFEDYYAGRDLPNVPTAFDGRSDYGPFLEVGIAAGDLFTGAEDIKTTEEALLFGGEAGVAYDINYHARGDNITNLALDAFEVNAGAIAFAVGTYAASLATIPVNTTTKRDAMMVKRSASKEVKSRPASGLAGASMLRRLSREAKLDLFESLGWVEMKFGCLFRSYRRSSVVLMSLNARVTYAMSTAV